MLTFCQFLEAKQNFLPGQLNDKGDKYEPKKEPELAGFILNQYLQDFGTSDEINSATGYLLPDGMSVQMGHGNRAQDHRNAIPTIAAMKRWKWPQEVIDQHAVSSSTNAMKELMRRSGAARIIASSQFLAVHYEIPLTGRQKSAIIHFVVRYRPNEVVFQYGARNVSLSWEDVENYLYG